MTSIKMKFEIKLSSYALSLWFIYRIRANKNRDWTTIHGKNWVYPNRYPFPHSPCSITMMQTVN